MDIELFKLVTKYRLDGKCKEGMELALGVLKTYKLNLTETDISNFSDSLRDKLIYLYYDISIIICYTKYKKYMLTICEKLLYTRNKIINYNNISENRRFVIPLLKDMMKIKTIDIPFDPPIISGTDKKFKTLNPSIITKDGNYYLNVRCVNYDNDRCINFTAIDKSYDNKIITRNFIIKLDNNFTALYTKELIYNNELEMKRNIVQGLEDIQLFSYNNDIHFICSTYCTSNDGVDMCHGIVDDSINLKSIHIIDYVNRNKVEKNWLPFIKNNIINLVYSQEPLTILSLENNIAKNIVKKNNEIKCSLMRGSGGPIFYKNGLLIINHEVVWNGNGRTYLHKFILYDNEFNVLKTSLPFKFENVEIQYCRSMSYSIDKTNIILGLGIEDKNALLYSFHIDEIEKILHVPKPFC